MSDWVIIQDGIPIGFFDSREDAVDALKHTRRGYVKYAGGE